MGKIVAGVLGLTLGIATINAWSDTPLQINYGTPEALGEQTLQVTAPVNQDENSNGLQTSIFAEYYGSKIGSNDLGGDQKLNGIGAGLTVIALNSLSTSVGLNFQRNSNWKNTEINVKGGYKFYNFDNTYANANIGVGYAWVKADDYDVKLRYVTLPVELEVGHYFQKDLAVYAGLGYKWLYIENLKDVCTSYFCSTAASDVLDLDGITYRVGLKYDF